MVGVGYGIVSTQDSRIMAMRDCCSLISPGVWLLRFVCIVIPMNMGGSILFLHKMMNVTLCRGCIEF